MFTRRCAELRREISSLEWLRRLWCFGTVFRVVGRIGLLAGLYVSLASFEVHSENWPQWRGPFLNGSTTETNLPVEFGRTEKVAWSTPLPGRSGATPVVWGDSVFLPSPDPDKNLLLFCLDAGTGQVRWQKRVSGGDQVMGKNNMASCSAVTDGKAVYSLFATGELAAFDYAGKELWRLSLAQEYGKFAHLFQYGASPLLFAEKLYIPILQRNPSTYGHAQDAKPDRQSWLVCVNPVTGKIDWAHERKTDAREEAMEAYTTPMPFEGPNGSELIVVGGDAVTSHRPENGEELWRFPGLNAKKISGGRIVPSPVVAPGFLFACGPKRETLVAIPAGLRGVTTTNVVAWRTDQYVPDVCTPLVYQGRLFVLDGDRQMLTCYRPATGDKVWQGKLGVREIFSASPTGADGKIYCMSEEATIVVLSAGESFEILSTVALEEGPAMSSIVAAGGRLFVRTAKNLYCIGNK